MNSAEKTLIILTPGFPENEMDSTCLPMQQQLVKSLQAIAPYMKIIVLSFQYPYHTKEYNWYGIQVIPFNGRNKGGLSRLLLRRRIKTELEKINRINTVTGLLSFWYGECALAGHYFASRYQLKHFCWILGQDAKKENKYARDARLEAGELIALSDFIRDEFARNHGLRPAHLIPAGIDSRQFSHTEKERDIHILGAGSLIPLKRYDLFIETIAAIKEKIPGLKAVLVGGGPEKGKLQNLINESGLATTLSLTGEIPYADVLQLMQRSKVLLHPSSYEGFSGVCLESLYAGAHVISFCKAMNTDIQQWHIVSSKEQMAQKTLSILQDSSMEFNRILYCAMDEVAKRMMHLIL